MNQGGICAIHYCGAENHGDDTAVKNSKLKSKEAGFEACTKVDSVKDLVAAIRTLLQENENTAFALWFKIDDIIDLKCKDIRNKITLGKIKTLFRRLERELTQFSRDQIAVLLDTWGLDYSEKFIFTLKKVANLEDVSRFPDPDPWDRVMAEARGMICKTEETPQRFDCTG